MSVRTSVLGVTLALVVSCAVAGAAWEPPKDGVVTEKQLVNCLQVQKEALDNWKAAGKAVDGSASGAAAMAVYLNADSKFKGSLAAHGMTQEEYQWVSEKVWEAWGALTMEKLLADTQKGLAEQRKTNEQKLADLKQRLSAYEKAQAEGRRVMSKDEREQAIQSAKAEQQSALDESRQHTDDLKQAGEEASKAEADAKAADALAKNPPSDVSADDRPGYIDQKKTEAQQARDAAKDAREKEAEAKKLLEESNAKAAAAGKRAANPDAPTTDDEKADVKKANEEEIASLKTDIADSEKGLKLLDESGQTFAKSMQDQRGKDGTPQQNVDLVRKHKSEFEAIWMPAK